MTTTADREREARTGLQEQQHKRASDDDLLNWRHYCAQTADIVRLCRQAKAQRDEERRK